VRLACMEAYLSLAQKHYQAASVADSDALGCPRVEGVQYLTALRWRTSRAWSLTCETGTFLQIGNICDVVYKVKELFGEVDTVRPDLTPWAKVLSNYAFKGQGVNKQVIS
jgi:hypothetical protein